jgi:hypothetical protein
MPLDRRARSGVDGGGTASAFMATASGFGEYVGQPARRWVAVLWMARKADRRSRAGLRNWRVEAKIP